MSRYTDMMVRTGLLVAVTIAATMIFRWSSASPGDSSELADAISQAPRRDRAAASAGAEGPVPPQYLLAPRAGSDAAPQAPGIGSRPAFPPTRLSPESLVGPPLRGPRRMVEVRLIDEESREVRTPWLLFVSQVASRLGRRANETEGLLGTNPTPSMGGLDTAPIYRYAARNGAVNFPRRSAARWHALAVGEGFEPCHFCIELGQAPGTSSVHREAVRTTGLGLVTGTLLGELPSGSPPLLVRLWPHAKARSSQQGFDGVVALPLGKDLSESNTWYERTLQGREYSFSVPGGFEAGVVEVVVANRLLARSRPFRLTPGGRCDIEPMRLPSMNALRVRLLLGSRSAKQYSLAVEAPLAGQVRPAERVLFGDQRYPFRAGGRAGVSIPLAVGAHEARAIVTPGSASAVLAEYEHQGPDLFRVRSALNRLLTVICSAQEFQIEREQIEAGEAILRIDAGILALALEDPRTQRALRHAREHAGPVLAGDPRWRWLFEDPLPITRVMELLGLALDVD